MGNSLFERQARPDYFACLLGNCENAIFRRMLCRKHYEQAGAEGWLWKFPGDYLDDYTDEGQDSLDEICSWIYELHFDRLISYFENASILWSAQGPATYRLGFGGATITDYGVCCLICGKSNVPFKRGLCGSCYDGLEAGAVASYPTKTFMDNVDGHIEFMVAYHPDRLADVGRFYGVRFGIAPTPVAARRPR